MESDAVPSRSFSVTCQKRHATKGCQQASNEHASFEKPRPAGAGACEGWTFLASEEEVKAERERERERETASEATLRLGLGNFQGLPNDVAAGMRAFQGSKCREIMPGWGTAHGPGYTMPGGMHGGIPKPCAKPLKPRASG